MKKNRAGTILKITALACVLVFALGVLIYGFATGFGLSDFVRPTDDGVYNTPYTYEEEVKTLQGIHVDWIAGSVTLEFYDGATVKVTETAKTELKEDEKLYLEVSGGELSIRWNSAWLLDALQEEPKQLEILIPAVFADGLEAVEISTVSGDIEIADLKAAQASFETVSGELRLSGITAESFEVKSTSGDVLCENISSAESLKAGSTSGALTLNGITGGVAELDNTSGQIILSGMLTELECGTISGDVQLDLTAWPEKMNIHTVSGSADILAPETEDGFLCKFSGVSGDFSTDFRTQKSGNLYQCGSGVYSVELETTSGDVTLNQKVG